MKYIVVQAGGRGSRMELLTRNKPKALVPVNNLPMIFHLFRQFPDSKFVIIGDYKIDVLERYLRTFADVDYELIRASGHKGTCAGLNDALERIPDRERFMLIWCDLILPNDCIIPDSARNIIGISKDFSCRWSYRDGNFIEERSSDHGVAGLFVFNEKNSLNTGGGMKKFLPTASLCGGCSLEDLSSRSCRSSVRKSMAFTANGVNCRRCGVARSIALMSKAIALSSAA